MTRTDRPEPGEAAAYYSKYIGLVPDGDICTTLERQLPDTLELLRSVPPDKVDHRYAPGKWSTREVLWHVNDTERLFAFRAFWFARGLEAALPSFDQDIAARHAGGPTFSWESHVDEFRSIRDSTVALFRHLPPEAWLREGIASGSRVTVRALAFITAGHVLHHAQILRERYL